MPQIQYLPDDRRIQGKPGEAILKTSLRAGIPHAHACGGKARCSTCRVRIEQGLEHCGPRNKKERELAAQLHLGPEIRLACQTTLQGNVTVQRLVLDDEDSEIIRDLKSGPTQGAVGEERSLAIMFADIRSFTSFTEALPAYDVIYVLNRYFHRMSAIIHRHAGYVDNYMGDGLMALFGVKNPKDAALRAVKAGIEMLEEVERLRPYLTSSYGRSFHIGIGIHYGDVVVGAVGSAELQKITAIGDAVNLASRIQAANKLAGTRLLISQATFTRVQTKIRAEKKCVRVSLPGKSGDYTLYEVIGPKS